MGSGVSVIANLIDKLYILKFFYSFNKNLLLLTVGYDGLKVTKKSKLEM